MSAFATTTDGVLDGTGTNVANNARQVARVYGSAAIAEGDWVAFDTTNTGNPAGLSVKSVRKADAANADAYMGICGVACETTTAAGMLTIQVRGRVNTADYGGGANVDSGSSTAIGENLMVGATAGRAIVYAASTAYAKRICAVTTTVPGSNRAGVEIVPHPFFAS